MAPRLVRNVLANWLALGTATVVGFVLTPYMLRHLGDTGFGLWVLVTTLTGYYGLLDLGFRAGVGQYLIRYIAARDYTKAAECITTAVMSRSARTVGARW